MKEEKARLVAGGRKENIISIEILTRGFDTTISSRGQLSSVVLWSVRKKTEENSFNGGQKHAREGLTS